MSDIKIAQAANQEKIGDIAKKIGLTNDDLELYGDYKAKLKYSTIEKAKKNKKGKLILVSAITPTPAGEGKTTTSIGLSMAINKIGKKSIVAIREPSLGPVFGIKGGAAGGGYSQVIPMEDINLHFTGDMHAITAANNNLAALIDNSIYNGNPQNIDPTTVVWKRVMDANDRALRKIVIGLGGRTQGVPREDGFDISPASEIMAILCLSNNISHLKKKIGEITVAFNYNKKPVKVKDMGFEGSIAALLKDALKPNLVQTLENTPALVHGGPFANIAQGTNSILATHTALGLSDYVVTEAGFGFDLGAEKYLDLVCEYAGFKTSTIVLVATARALKHHGGVKVKKVNEPNLEALKEGLENLGKHLDSIKQYGVNAVVAVNEFPTDTQEELDLIKAYSEEQGFTAHIVQYWAEGGNGGLDLAKKVVELADASDESINRMYDWDEPIEDKILKVAKGVYGAAKIELTSQAKKDIRKIKKNGYGKLPICIAKTQKSLSDKPKLKGRPKGFTITVQEVLIASGAGFVIPITGEIMRMPGLPKRPSALDIDIEDDGTLLGLF